MAARWRMAAGVAAAGIAAVIYREFRRRRRTTLLLLEHVNVCSEDREATEAFFAEIGCAADRTRPANRSLHMNCGPLTQFHFDSGPPSPWRGVVEVVVPDSDPVNWETASGRGTYMKIKCKIK